MGKYKISAYKINICLFEKKIKLLFKKFSILTCPTNKDTIRKKKIYS